MQIFKQKISPAELAKRLYGLTTRRTSPTIVFFGGPEKVWCGEQDTIFLGQARQELPLLDQFRYETEVECLSFFVSWAAALQEMRPRTRAADWEGFARSWLQNIANHKQALGMSGVLFIREKAVGIDDLIQERMQMYITISNEVGIEGVAQRFSRECCGLVNQTLTRIGSSLYAVRGAELILFLRPFRIVEP